MSKYRVSVSIDEDNFFWIVIDNGKLIKSPTKEDLRGTKLISYNKTNICPICREYKDKEGKELTDKSILYPKNVYHEKDKNGKKTGELICVSHRSIYRNRYDPNSTNNIIKSMRNIRTGNIDQNCNTAKGRKGEKLLSRWKNLKDLNKENDNYSTGTRRDCLDEKTELYYQAKIAYYNPVYRSWHQNFIDEYNSIREGFRFKSLFMFCVSEDGKRVERVLEIPEKDIYDPETCEGRTNITAYKSPTDCVGNSIIPWYGQYISIDKYKDPKELDIVNMIWQEILEEDK